MIRGLAIDPGLHKSGVVFFEWWERPPQFARQSRGVSPVWSNQLEHQLVLTEISEIRPSILVVETIPGLYGGHAASDQLETERWGARYMQRHADTHGGSDDSICRISRAQARSSVTGGVAKCGDPAVRAAIIDLYGGQSVSVGGRKCKACAGKGWRGRNHDTCAECNGAGTETPPGPLHGWTGSHGFAALACALAWAQQRSQED